LSGGGGVLICVPCYNEAENIEPFVHAVFDNAPESTGVLIVDDSSPDGTAAIVTKLQKKYPQRLHLLSRPEKQGGASAFLQSFAWGIKQGYDFMLAMDADFSHDPKYIQDILAKSGEYDVVLGSRLVKGGGIENRSFSRNIISHGASLYCRVLLSPFIKDWTGGYNLWSKKALEKIGVSSIFTRGYSFQIEMKYKAFQAGCAITEIPVVFPDRKKGASKMSPAYFAKALVDVWRIKFHNIKSEAAKQVMKFAITGGLGTITNLALFFLLADIAELPVIPVSIACFIISGTQNYFLHHTWSFSQNTRGTPFSINKWLLFLSSALLGLMVNISAVQILLQNFTLPYKVIAQACGILAGMVINFITAKFVVFRRKYADKFSK
jgi:dolichol-phosphate mannosyltransferase